MAQLKNNKHKKNHKNHLVRNATPFDAVEAPPLLVVLSSLRALGNATTNKVLAKQRGENVLSIKPCWRADKTRQRDGSTLCFTAIFQADSELYIQLNRHNVICTCWLEMLSASRDNERRRR